PRAGHWIVVGPADVGHLLGMGCAADLGADPVPDVSWPDGAVARGRGSGAGGAGGRGADTGRRDQPAHHQVLGRLVEHAAPAGLGVAPGRIDARRRLPDSASGDGDRLHIAVRHAASGGDAQRNPAPSRAQPADDAGEPEGRVMSLGPYASFIVSAYSLVAAVLVLLIGWIVVDYRNPTQ